MNERSKYVVMINRVLPKASCENILNPGDIIFALEENLIVDNLYLFDK